MMNNFTIITKLNNKIDLVINAVLFIKEEKPIINIQANNLDRKLKKI